MAITTKHSLKYSRKEIDDIINALFVDDYNPDHQSGPDYILPTEDIWTTSISGGVKVLPSKAENVDDEPISIVTLLKRTVETHPQKIALSVKRNDEWINWTYEQFWDEIRTTAGAFIKFGLKRFQAVAILGFNAPEWILSYYAAIFAGGVSTGIYITNSPSSCEYVLKHSKSCIVVVENETQLKKILQVKENLPHLNAIVQYTGSPSHEDVFSWEDLKRIGATISDSVLEKRVKSLAVNQCCSLLFTSGTTGNPKAVMLSHANYVNFSCFSKNYMMAEKLLNGEKELRVVSFLPFSHIGAQMIDIYIPLVTAGRVYFAQPDALKGSLISTLQEVQPTMFGSVPRVVEKIKEKFEAHFANTNILTRGIINWALRCGFVHTMNRLKRSTSKPFGYYFAQKILQNIRKQLGVADAESFIVAGAPISRNILEFFFKLEVVFQEGYGLSESTGLVIINPLSKYRLSSCGKVNDLSEFKISNPDSDGIGEILIRSRSVFMGYLDDEKNTKEATDEDRWLYTGDTGRIDDEDFLFVTGRIKEIVITSGGENVSPIPIEDAVKDALPIVNQAMVVGDKKKYLTMLLTLKTIVDLETLTPLDTLDEVSIEWCRRNGSEAETLQDILKGPDVNVMEAIQKGIDRANEKATSNACKIQKWKILSRDFSIQEDELGPTMKLKRFFIQKKYEKIIDTMYQ